MTDKVFNVRFKWTPAALASDSSVKRFQEEHGVYHEEYESSVTVRAPDFVQAEKRALDVVRARFPEGMMQPGWSSRPWTHAVTRKVADDI